MYASIQVKGNSNGSGSSCGSSCPPSDSEAMEKLVVYVYEYLLHQGATRTAQTFLSEMAWDKNITLNDPPGFLVSWWSVFYDLYCAAPERRDTYLHSPEAKAFHDQVSGQEASATYPERPVSNVSVPNMPNSGYYHSHMRRSPSLSAPLGSAHLGSSPLPHHSPQAVMPGPYLGNHFPATPVPSMRTPPQALSSGSHLQLSSHLKQSQRNQQALPYHPSPIPPAMHGMGHPGISPKNYPQLPPVDTGGCSMSLSNGAVPHNGLSMGPRGSWSHPLQSPLPSGPLRTSAHQSPQDSASPYGFVAGEPPRLSLPDGSGVLESAQDDPSESVAIQRIKESMKEEVKKFEKEHVEYYHRH